MRIEWDFTMEVGVEAIDREHRRLVEIYNELLSSIEQSDTDKGEGVVLDELFDYTQSHFKNEEALFEEHSYPGLSDVSALGTY